MLRSLLHAPLKGGRTLPQTVREITMPPLLPLRSFRKPPTVTVADLQAVRRALRHGVWLGREKGLLGSRTVMLLLLTALTTLLLLSLSSLLTVQAKITTLPERTPVVLPIQQTAPRHTVQAFLAMLQSLSGISSVRYETREQQYEQLQQVRPDDVSFLRAFMPENPLSDRILLSLRSVGDLELLRTLLQRPTFQHVLAPSFPWSLRSWEEGMSNALFQLRRVQTFLGGAVLLSACVLACALAQAFQAHKRATQRERQQLLLLGADARMLSMRSLREVGTLAAGALLLASLLSWGLLRAFPAPFPL